MLRAIASSLSRNGLALVALMVALGGTSYAAIQLPRNSVGTGHLRSGAVRTADLGAGAVTLSKINRNARTALSGPPGPAGPQGATGPAGPKGDTGTVDTSAFYSKGESDARFLGSGSVQSLHRLVPSLDPAILDVGGVRVIGTCGPGGSALQFGNITGDTVQIINQTNGTAEAVGSGGSAALGGANNGETAHAVVQVAWGAALERVTTFTFSLERPAGGCPARVWGTAVTDG